jgi:hypothetical protein
VTGERRKILVKGRQRHAVEEHSFRLVVLAVADYMG